jgi:hypothetical protein
MAERLKETEVAAAVVAWLEEAGWDVYQEVQVKRFGRIADIVAVMERRVWIIECKTSLSMAVIGQAYDWQESVHWVSVAVPILAKRKGGYPIRGQRPRFVNRVLRDYGIGLIKVERKETFGQAPAVLQCHEAIHPQSWRVTFGTYATGSARNRRRSRRLATPRAIGGHRGSGPVGPSGVQWRRAPVSALPS